MTVALLWVALATAGGDALVVKGRVEGYGGLFPLHVAALHSPDLAAEGNPLAWGTVDPATGKFDIPIPASTQRVYLFAHLDQDRIGPSLNGGFLFFLNKLPLHPDDLVGKRHIFQLGDMDLAISMRDSKKKSSWWIALGVFLGLFGLGAVWYRRLPATPARVEEPLPGWTAIDYGIALITTLPLVWALGEEPLELLEFTYLHEGLRPTSIWALLSDPISAELSHPPLWPLLLRAMSMISRSEWWLRSPALLAHAAAVLFMIRLVAHDADRWVARFAGGLLGVLPVAAYYARDATPYSMLTLVSVLALLFARREQWRAFAAVFVVGFFSHYTVAILGVFTGVGLFWHYRATGSASRFRRSLVGFGLIIVLPVAWSAHFIQTFLASGMSTRLMSVDYLPDPGLLSYVSHFGAIVLGLPPELGLFVVPPVLLLLALGAVRVIVAAPVTGRLVLLQVVMVVGYVLFVHAMYMRFAGGRVFYAYRWTSVFLPGVAIVLAWAVHAVWDWRRPAGAILAVAMLLSAAVTDLRMLTEPQRPAQWDVAEKLRALAEPGDAFCALPAVYYGQLFNYALANRNPEDLLAWPGWRNQLYGPIHPTNTSLETVSRNLAFGHIWVVAYQEEMFGTRKFDSRTTAHHLAWMAANLIQAGHWTFPHVTLSRFKVPPRPELLWDESGRKAQLNFAHEIDLFRYFPAHLHTQETGRVLSEQTVRVRIPLPKEGDTLTTVVDMTLGRPAVADDLTLTPGEATFLGPTDSGGRWSLKTPIPQDSPRPALLELTLQRSGAATVEHRNTVLDLSL